MTNIVEWLGYTVVYFPALTRQIPHAKPSFVVEHARGRAELRGVAFAVEDRPLADALEPAIGRLYRQPDRISVGHAGSLIPADVVKPPPALTLEQPGRHRTRVIEAAELTETEHWFVAYRDNFAWVATLDIDKAGDGSVFVIAGADKIRSRSSRGWTVGTAAWECACTESPLGTHTSPRRRQADVPSSRLSRAS